MAIQLKGPACIAVSQDSMYAVIEGSYPLGGDNSLLTLVKTEYPTAAAGNNTWTVVSTMPAITFWTEDYNVFGQVNEAVCIVHKNGVFTFRLSDGGGLHYDPMAPKTPQYQTCSSGSSGLGEWILSDLVDPNGFPGWPRLYIRPEIVGSDNDSNGGYSDGDEMVIYRPPLNVQGPPTLWFARIKKEALLANITSDDLSPPVMLSEKNATIEVIEYGDSQIFSVLAFEPKIPLVGTNQTTYNKTLMYFPLQAPFHLTSPPTAAVSVPWNVDCGLLDVSVAAVAKARFYYVCSGYDLPKKRRTFRLYIFDSKTRQTQGPFTSQSDNTPIANPFVHLFPVYNASYQDEPQFLVANWLAQYNEPADPSAKYYVPTVIDLHALNSSPQAWPRFSLPESIPVGKDLGPSCHTRRSSQKLAIASIVSGLFGAAVVAILVFRWRRKRKSGKSVADDTSE
ncbi:hypothetical protein CPB97_006413 [Podila verticillata]|nr:hypothetical protein CPB97_006413 [Podila verticillata]